MPIEHASVRAIHKPWGVSDLQPWSDIDGTRDAVGELWFERADQAAPTPGLLLKLLFTREPLSIQVHPDDTFARAMGMPNGKSEAWYIISAKPGAQIGIGLKRRVTQQELRVSIADGSIVELVQWRPVAKGVSFSSRPAQSTLLALALCWRKFSSAAIARSACSTMAEGANCT